MATVFSAPALGTRQKHGQLTQSLLCQEIRVSQRPPEFVLFAPPVPAWNVRGCLTLFWGKNMSLFLVSQVTYPESQGS